LKTTKAITDPLKAAKMTIALKRVHLRFALLWEMGCHTGLRISDLLTLKTSHFSGTDSVAITEKKTGNVRNLTISPEIMLDIMFFKKIYGLKPDDYLFFSRHQKKHKPMSRQWAHRVIARTASYIGLQNVSSHSMRKIYACDKFVSTGSINDVKRELGHKHLSTTLIYLKDLLQESYAGV